MVEWGILGLYWDNGIGFRETTMVEWGILGLYWDNGKEHEHFYIIYRAIGLGAEG